MKKILILSKYRDEFIKALCGSYEIVDRDAELIIFDGGDPIPECKTTLAVFDGSVSEGAYSDFILYPFRTDELILRIGRLLDADSVFKNGGLLIDTSRSFVSVNGIQVHLTMLEYRLLCLLAGSCGKVLEYQNIICGLWGSPIGSEIRSLRVFVNALRKKLGISGLIKNVMGKGYIMQKLTE